MKNQIVFVTPEMAAAWLEKVDGNRNVNQSRVDAFARDMKRGEWKLTGESLKFSTEGVLMDGQHRLWACVSADAPFETVVARGVDPDSMLVIDTGARRTLGDALTIRGGVKSAALLAGIVNIVWRYEKNGWRNNETPTHTEAAEWLADNPSVVDSVPVAHHVRSILRVAPSPIGAAHFLNARHDAEAADEFWRKAAMDDPDETGDATIALRRWIMQVAAKRDRPTSRTQFGFFLAAMNAWRDGRKLRVLQWKSESGLPPTWGEQKTTGGANRRQKGGSA